MSLNQLTHGKRMTVLALILAMTLSTMAPVFASDDEKFIYGPDDRKDVYQVTDPQQRQWAAATCALVEDWRMFFDDQAQQYTLFTVPYVQTEDGINYVEACPEEPFGNQELGAFCSGFLIAPNVVATAGHCITDSFDMMNTYFVFGFEMESATRQVTEFSTEQVYRPVAEITWALDNTMDGRGRDFGVWLLDRPVEMTGMVPFNIRTEGMVETGQHVGVIGHPNGLPKKVVFGDTTVVKENEHPWYFTANTDALGGNSGSPVIAPDTGLVEGILVRGSALFPHYIIEDGCFVSNVLPDDEPPYVEMQRTTTFADDVENFLEADLEMGFRASPARDAQGQPVVMLTWENPVNDEGRLAYQSITIVRAVRDYTTSADEGTVVYSFTAGATLPANVDDLFLDYGVRDGVDYYYTLFANPVELWYDEVLSFATATVNDEPIQLLAEAFGLGFDDDGGYFYNPLDVANRQITFSPTTGTDPAGPYEGADVATHGGYEVSIVRGLTRLPVARDDGDTDAFQIALADDSVIGFDWSFLGQSFPFYGKRYETMYVGANGYVAFEPVSSSSALNWPFAGVGFPSLANHYAVPRISYLFSDLNPSAGGEMWIKPMDDRMVLTQEDIPDAQPMLLGESVSINTVQVELFFSGHIRITYLNVGVPEAIIGLSDGRGVPRLPSEETTFLDDTFSHVDLSAAPAVPGRLTIAPTAPQRTFLGGLLRFTAQAVAPPDVLETPVLYASWDGPGPVPFADNGDGTGSFSWQSTVFDEGDYTVRVRAEAAGQTAYQAVQVHVLESYIYPEARDLRLYLDGEAPGDPDGAADRLVGANENLVADYTYYHEQGLPEGPTRLTWMRNGLVVPGLENQSTVPAGMTRGGDVWNFTVLPVALYADPMGEAFLYGMSEISPSVTIDGSPAIVGVTPNMGRMEGGETVRIIGRDFSGLIGIYFNETKVDYWHPAGTVTQDGVVYDVLEVTTPLHPPATVDVRIRTNVGEVILEDAFTYVDDETELVLPDVNNDKVVDALDIQIVLNAILQTEGLKTTFNPDVNRDGVVNTTDLQLVVNEALVL